MYIDDDAESGESYSPKDLDNMVQSVRRCVIAKFGIPASEVILIKPVCCTNYFVYPRYYCCEYSVKCV